MTLNPNDPNHGCCVPAPPAAQPTTKERFTALGEQGGDVPTFPSQVARKAYFGARLATDEKWAYRALMLIFSFQTADEQASDSTTNANGAGFNSHDADILSSYAKQYDLQRSRVGGKARLTPNQRRELHRRIRKYAGQVIDHMAAQDSSLVTIVRSRKAVA